MVVIICLVSFCDGCRQSIDDDNDEYYCLLATLLSWVFINNYGDVICLLSHSDGCNRGINDDNGAHYYFLSTVL